MRPIKLACCLGSARFSVSSDTNGEILESTKQEKSDPNLFRTRGDTPACLAELRHATSEHELERIAELKRG